LAHALGGEVADNPKGIEAGTVDTRVCDHAWGDRLFSGITAPFKVQVGHRQVVKVLPPGAQRLLSTSMDANHAFSVNGHAWGLQFHPEFDMETTRCYLEYYRPALSEEGRDADKLLKNCSETPVARRVLGNFSQLASDAMGQRTGIARIS